jgi:geranylgeranyl diphosphate synthase type II
MKSCAVDEWARNLKQQYFEKAMFHLDEVAVMSSRKQPLNELAHFLIGRDH